MINQVEFAWKKRSRNVSSSERSCFADKKQQ